MMKKGAFYLSLAVILYMVTFINNIPDYDLWARLAVGSIFFQIGHLFKHDIFSYLPTKDLWVDHEWGSSVVFYFFTRYFGEWGIFALNAIILSAIFILIIKIIKLQTDDEEAGIFYFTFLGFSLLPGIDYLIRCQIFTYLFFTLWIYLLERVKRGENKLIWIFPVTMLLWANMHGGFLAGIGLILIYAFGEMFNRKNSLKYFRILALILLVTLINPYGMDLWSYIIEASLMPRPYIKEWTSISLSGPFHVFGGIKIHVLVGFMIFVLLTFASGIKLFLQREKPDWTKIILVIVLLYLGVKHQRHTEFFTLAVSGLFYHRYVNLFSAVDGFIKNKLNGKTYQIWKAIEYGFGYFLLGAICIYVIPKLSNSMIVNPSNYPVGSLEFIKQNNISGNLATKFEWGSYALWKLYPRCKVLIDGRYEEVYSNEIYAEAMQFSEHGKNWQEILRKYHSDILVLSKGVYTRSDLSSLTDWKLVYEDRVSALLLLKNKIKPVYIYPDYNNRIYWKENFSKGVNLN